MAGATRTLKFGLIGVVLAIWLAPSASASPLTLWASPTGTWSTCAQTDPCSIARAQHRLRAFLSGTTILGATIPGTATVNLLGGTYELESTLGAPLTLTGTVDSGADEAGRVTWRSAPEQSAVLSGGRTIPSTAWSDPDLDGIWQADVDDLNTRQLWVNGLRATRARWDEPPQFLLSTKYPKHAAMTTALAGNANDLTFTAAVGDVAVNPPPIIRVRYVVAENNTPLTVTVDASNRDITVDVATSSVGLAVSTANQVRDAVNDYAPANALVTASNAEGTGSGIVAALGYTELLAGAQAPPEGGRGYDPASLATHFTAIDAAHLAEIEAVARQHWRHARCGIKELEDDPIVTVPARAQNIVMDQPCWRNTNLLPFGDGVDFNTVDWFENALSFLDTAGEWYLDRTTTSDRTLYYKPRAGEVTTVGGVQALTAPVVAPVLETLVKGIGTLDNPLKFLTFEGLKFTYATWLGPDNPNGDGYAEWTAGFHIVGDNDIPSQIPMRDYANTDFDGEWVKTPSAVTLTGPHNVLFHRNVFERMGTGGLNLETGAQDNDIVGNVFRDLSGPGITLGGVTITDHHPTDLRSIVKNNTLTNNFITKIGQEYEASVGIWSGFTENTMIAYNKVLDVPYIGIFNGWGWGRFDSGGSPLASFAEYIRHQTVYQTATTLKNVTIAYNLIEKPMMVLDDGGGLYAQSDAPNSQIYRNVFRDSGYGRNPEPAPGGSFYGIYLDAGSRHWDIHHNVFWNNCRTAIIKGGDHVVHDNHWDVDPGDPNATPTPREDGYHQASNLNGILCKYHPLTYNNQRDSSWAVVAPIEPPQQGNLYHELFSQMPDNIVDNAGLQTAYEDIETAP